MAKKVLEAIIVSLFIFSVVYVTSALTDTYTRDGVVVAASPLVAHTMTITDEMGETWVMPWKDCGVVGSKVTVVMSSNGTDYTADDDYAVKVKKGR